MFIMFALICTLTSSVVVEAAQIAVLNDEDDTQEICICADCYRWWRPYRRSHPFSSAEKLAARAIAALPLADASGSGQLGPYLDLIFEYIGEDIGSDENKWCLIKKKSNILALSLNASILALSLNASFYTKSHAHSLVTDAPFLYYDPPSIFPKDVVFGDGNAQVYISTLYDEGAKIETISHCGRYRALIEKPRGNRNRLTVTTYCRDNTVLSRIASCIKNMREPKNINFFLKEIL